MSRQSDNPGRLSKKLPEISILLFIFPFTISVYLSLLICVCIGITALSTIFSAYRTLSQRDARERKLDWYLCQICYPLETDTIISIILLLSGRVLRRYA